MPPPRDVKKSTQLTDDEKRVVGNRYRIEKKLGSGNFGTAFLCTDLKDNNTQKVLKEVSVGDMQSDESIESVHEANLLSKLSHPNILKYSDSFLDGEYFCIVTEYCEGGDLDVRFKQMKKENKKLTEEQVLDWTVQLISAVNYMHSRRVLHRDLKARNIFLKSESVKIGDFGISRILQGTMDMASTFTGTPYYMSPEVLKHEGYNSKSDVWSIGCLLYEMCTFQHAFEGQGLMGVMYKIVEGRVPELPNTYSKELNNILKKIFRKDPNSRPSTTELLQEPYIKKHCQSMVERYQSNKIIDLDSTVMVRNDRSEIAKALNAKVSLKDLQLKSPAADLKATPVVQGKPPKTTDNKATDKKVVTPAAAKEDHDDDDDIRSGRDQPVARPKTTAGGVRSQPVVSTPPPSAQAAQAPPPAQYQQPIKVDEEPAKKELTPKEKMLLNKLKKADEEAAKVGQFAKENLQERMLRETLRREGTIFNAQLPNINTGIKANSSIRSDDAQQATPQRVRSSDRPGSGSRTRMMSDAGPYEYEATPGAKHEYELVNGEIHTLNRTQNAQTLRPSVSDHTIGNRTQKVIINNQVYVIPDNGGDDEGTLLQTVQFVNDQVQRQQQQQYGYASNIPQPIKLNYDSRPIRPMKTKVENVFDDQGIPFDPNVTNEYYSNEDFENDSSPERKQPSMNTYGSTMAQTRASMSRTVAPNRRRVTTAVTRQRLPTGKKPTITGSNSNLVASKTFSSAQPRSNQATRNEYEELIDFVQNAVNGQITQTEFFGDDAKTSVFGQRAKDTKLQNLRAQAMRRLGEDSFNNVYTYLREQRRGPNANNVDENKILDGLKHLGVNPSDCFLVDQLLFLEGM